MARWGVIGTKGAGNVKSGLVLAAAAANMRRAKIYDWIVGSAATPADAAFNHIAQRTTTLATGAARTPNALDQADTLASTIVCTDTVTVDPTLTAGAFLLQIPLNQRATLRWVAAPNSELVIPATANNGIMFGLSAASTTDISESINYEEY